MFTATKSSLFGFRRNWRGDVSVPPELDDSARSVMRSRALGGGAELSLLATVVARVSYGP